MARPLEPALSLEPERASNLRGIIAMVFGMGCFVASDTLIKIIGRDMPIGQIMFTRGLLATVMIGCLVAMTGVWQHYRAVLTPLVAWRTAGEIGATLFFFAGLVRLPFADAAAIGQFTPLAVTAGAAMFLGEPVGWRRWMATGVGLVGVMIIIRPGTSAFNWAALLIVACVLFVAMRDLITRRLGPGVPTLLIILVSSMAITAAGLFMRTFEAWITPSWTIMGGLALSALGVSGGYYGSIIAMRAGEISVIAPFRYSVILFALFWAYVLFEEVPDRWTWTGVIIVVAAGLYTVHRERVRRREAERALAATAVR